MSSSSQIDWLGKKGKLIILYLAELTNCGLIDLCVVVDSSGSIRDNNPPDRSYDNWQLILEFLCQVTMRPYEFH